MRHFFAAGAVPRFAGRMAEATGTAPLVAMAGVVERGATGVVSTGA